MMGAVAMMITKLFTKLLLLYHITSDITTTNKNQPAHVLMQIFPWQ